MGIERGTVLDDAKRVINGERQDQYGNPENNFARIARFWSAWTGHHISPHDVAVMMCLLKIARMQGGAPTRDSYTDLCGYAALAADLQEESDHAR